MTEIQADLIIAVLMSIAAIQSRDIPKLIWWIAAFIYFIIVFFEKINS